MKITNKILLVCLGIISCTSHKKTDTQTTIPAPANSDSIVNDLPEIIRNRIEDSLLKVPEVMETNRYIDSFSNHKSGVSWMIDKTDDQNYEVRVGYNGPDHFETYYTYDVDGKTFTFTKNDPLNSD